MVRLRSTQGADECNWGGQRYRVDNDGTAWVDEEAVGPLLEKGGFVLVDLPAPVEVAVGMIRLIHSHDPAATATFAGKTYLPDADGIVTVPLEALGLLSAHGFVIASPPRRILPEV